MLDDHSIWSVILPDIHQTTTVLWKNRLRYNGNWYWKPGENQSCPHWVKTQQWARTHSQYDCCRCEACRCYEPARTLLLYQGQLHVHGYLRSPPTGISPVQENPWYRCCWNFPLRSLGNLCYQGDWNCRLLASVSMCCGGSSSERASVGTSPSSASCG